MTAPTTLGIDFGTSNSAAGVAVNGMPHLIALEPGEQTLPTAVFFPEHGSSMAIGSRATRALIEGQEGRFMRALKSVLGTSLMHEERRIQGRRQTLIQIVAQFLAEVKTRAETATGMTFTHALSGRPVRFHSSDEARNARAEEDLRACYIAAGFDDVQFMLEPEAALRATPPGPGIGLIVDIGGGTSDFTAFEQTSDGSTRILTSYGVRLGGTDFDRRLSIDHVMPELGRGTELRNAMGAGTLPAPARIFNDLATWAMIPFLYTPETRRMAKDMARQAVDPVPMGRLVTVLEEELGHDLAFAVERGKIAVNGGGGGKIGLAMVERGLAVLLNADALDASLNEPMSGVAEAAAETLRLAGIPPERVERVILVGGSSLMHGVSDGARALCPQARIESGRALTAVADGLALASAAAFR